ncbi:MAG: hypothetical protein H0X17_21885 [Deltaproteobacteria bacterium]|nr:hypothetical protein [Deltaproteobacteria bacterium]
MPRIALLMFLAITVAAIVPGAGCSRRESAKHLELDLIRVLGDARMRTDTVGAGTFTDRATFVLVDAENAARTGAYVTLGGSLTDAAGAVTGPLKPQSLWIPAGEVRTFALVDAAREPRPGATSAKIEVRGALIADPPQARIEELHSFDDAGKIVVQAALVNDSPRAGQVLVIAVFHERDGRPMTRPFSLVQIGPQRRTTVQFVGPPGSVRGTIFIGEETY